MHLAVHHADIERRVRHLWSPIPTALLPAFHAHQLQHALRFLLMCKLLGHAAYFSYVVADHLAVPDVARTSLLMRSAFLAATLPVCLALFRWCKNVRVLDLLLPLQVTIAAALWFWLLGQSRSPLVGTYLYASVIFIVLANLGVRVRFVPSLITSLAITAVILNGVVRLHPEQPDAVMVFALVYLPVLFFSVYISWSNTLQARRNFLRSLLDRGTRDALATANERLQTLAATDALTGIANRRQFDERAQAYWAARAQQGHHFAVLLADIDYFKPFNDQNGHPAGDACLVQVAAILSAATREGEALVGRYGGEEFAVLLSTDRPAVVHQVAQRLCQAVAQRQMPHPHRPDGLGIVTLSLGGALSSHPQATSLEALMALADSQLYEAKRAGRHTLRIA
ncbi:GGDEF domain-containing protein [uncultured Aquabacterium sp.]|uniref:GGDEF domain-containing protein n=1 Tax=uncultured Aquabacterium sp. TaxID=158753 RepID=UPI002620145A|nr:GGDEF domain-containing protein [uncultured Aquabacterium sp.]